MRGRSFTRPDRCPRCRLVDRVCLCAELPTVVTRARIVVIRHVREVVKPSGTARIAQLALPSLEIVDYRDERGPLPDWLRDDPLTPPDVLPPDLVGDRLRTLDGAALLFPTGRTSEEPPRTLVVLDGTWRQARQMYRRIPGCAALPTVSLSGGSDVRRLRSSRAPGERSTLEAIADALAILEGEEVAAPLRALHDRFVLQSLKARGRTPPL